MAILSKWFGQGVLGMFSATEPRRVDWVNDTIKVALVKGAYVPNQDTHDFFNDVTNETAGAGYVAGGKELAEKVASYDAASNTVRLDAADLVWAGITVEFRYAVVYKDTGEAGSSPLLGYIDMGKEEAVVGGEIKLEFAEDGVLRLVVAE